MSDTPEVLYQKSTLRNSEGRYVVTSPLKDSSALGDNASQKLKTIYYLKKRFSKNCELKDQYITFMEEYLQLGYT